MKQSTRNIVLVFRKYTLFSLFAICLKYVRVSPLIIIIIIIIIGHLLLSALPSDQSAVQILVIHIHINIETWKHINIYTCHFKTRKISKNWYLNQSLSPRLICMEHYYSHLLHRQMMMVMRPLCEISVCVWWQSHCNMCGL